MRIKFEFSDSYELPDKAKELDGKIIWVNDFPGRLFNEDMIMALILGKKFKKKYESIIDNPSVACHRFDKDKYGYYQHVWLQQE